MQNELTYYKDLLADFIANRLSLSKVDELLDFIQSNPAEYDRLLEAPEIVQQLEKQAYNEAIPASDLVSDRMRERLMRSIEQKDKSVIRVVHRIDFLKRPGFRWMVAAAAILLVVGYWVLHRQSLHNDGTTNIVQRQSNDVKAPDKSRATIVLADGRTVYLDSTGNGRLAAQNGVEVIKNSDGAIVYQQAAGQQEGSKAVAYNTLYNPRGSKVMNLTLADGTRVWLNSESSLRYPTVFTGNSREVEITGEAYFEVAHNAPKPFHVKKGTTDVTVLGTHFNVNAYEDEDALKVTLLEGKVKVSNKGEAVIIKPGEQARLTSNYKLQTINSIDLDAVMAWKNGRFEFNETDLQTVMRQVGRWYDMEVVFEGTVTQHFNGTIPRQASAAQVLKMLEKTGGVQFSIEGKKVIVKQ